MKTFLFIIAVCFSTSLLAQLPSERAAGNMYPQHKKQNASIKKAPSVEIKKLPSQNKLPKQATKAAVKSNQVKKPAAQSEAQKQKSLPSNRKNIRPEVKPPGKP